MALIKCPECGKDVSDKAEACPNCAYPIAKLKESNVVEHNEATETETQQNKEVSTKINNESDNKMSLEEELRIREERRRKRREAALIKKRKARRRKIIIISCIAVALIAILAFLIIKPQNQKISGSSASYGSNNKAKTEYSLDERKELVETAFIEHIYSSAVGVADSGKFTNVYWPNLRYSTTVKQVSDTHYEVEAILVLYDKYENELAVSKDVYGEVDMKPNGEIEKVKAYNYFNYDWY